MATTDSGPPGGVSSSVPYNSLDSYEMDLKSTHFNPLSLLQLFLFLSLRYIQYIIEIRVCIKVPLFG